MVLVLGFWYWPTLLPSFKTTECVEFLHLYSFVTDEERDVEFVMRQVDGPRMPPPGADPRTPDRYILEHCIQKWHYMSTIGLKIAKSMKL